MSRLVMKFGGTSVATIERIRMLRGMCSGRSRRGMMSSSWSRPMSGKTNELVAWCKDASALHDMREY